jgi:hypothetical protein
VRKVIIILLFILGLLLSITVASFTQIRYELTAPKVLVLKSYNYLISQIGKTEIGNNRGIADEYNRSIGNPLGSPYCQAGQYWCYVQACNELNIPYYEIPMPRNGLANSTFNYAMRLGKRTGYTPQVHDLIIWKSVYNSTGHIERIVSVRNGGWVYTVGFNTGVKSQDNGEGVSKMKRNIRFPLNRIKKIRGLVGVRGI